MTITPLALEREVVSCVSLMSGRRSGAERHKLSYATAYLVKYSQEIVLYVFSLESSGFNIAAEQLCRAACSLLPPSSLTAQYHHGATIRLTSANRKNRVGIFAHCSTSFPRHGNLHKKLAFHQGHRGSKNSPGREWKLSNSIWAVC